MSGSPLIRERPGGSRIDDLGPHVLLSADCRPFPAVHASTSAHPGPGPTPAALLCRWHGVRERFLGSGQR